MIVSNPIFEYREYVSVKIVTGGSDANLGQRMSFKDQILTEIVRPTVLGSNGAKGLFCQNCENVVSKYCCHVCVPVLSKPVLLKFVLLGRLQYAVCTGLAVQRLGLY